MKIAIVGAQEDKWNTDQKSRVKAMLLNLLTRNDTLVSGQSPKGGIDIWAEEAADATRAKKLIFKPNFHRWEPDGYKDRNIRIAQECDIMYVFSPEQDEWNGGKWTGKYAEELGKKVIYIDIKEVVKNGRC